VLNKNPDKLVVELLETVKSYAVVGPLTTAPEVAVKEEPAGCINGDVKFVTRIDVGQDMPSRLREPVNVVVPPPDV
jgi:hypothetical protein